MATPVYVLTVNGAIVPLRIGFTIHEVANGRNRLSLSLYSATGAPPIALFDDVRLTEDGVVIFGGIVDAPMEAGAGGYPITPTITTVSVGDFNQLAERRVINLTFAAGTLAAQLAQLLTAFGSAGVTLDPAQPTGPMLPQWTAQYWRVDDVLNQLTTLSGGYLWNINYSRVLAMRPAASSLAPVHVTDANRVAIGDLTVTPTAESFANRVYLFYGDGQQSVTETYAGTGAATTFPVRHVVASHVGYVVSDGVMETLSNEGIGFDLAATWLYSPTNKTIRRVAGPPAAGAPIAFTYTGSFPSIVSADAPGGITTPPGLWEVTLHAPDVFDHGVAQQMAIDEAAIRSARPRVITYRTHERGIHPGQSQAITKTPRHLASVACVISEVTIQNTRGGPTDRIVTAIEGSRFPGTWRDMIRGWNDAGSSAGVVTPSAAAPPGGGGGAALGPGTPGTLAIWTGTAAIGDSIVAQSGGVITVAGGLVATTLAGNGAGLTNLDAGALATGTVPVARLPQFVGGDVVTAAPGSVNLQLVAGAVGAGDIADGAITSAKIADGTIQAIDLADGSVTNAKIAAGAVTTDKIADGTITNADISATAAIAWTKIDKSGAILDDLGGTLPWAKLPTGAGTWTGTPTISGSLTVSAHLYGLTPYSQDVGELSKKFRAIHAAELWVETLVAQATAATIGGRVLIGPTTILKRDVAPGDTAIYVKHNSLQLQILELGSKLILESGGRFEIMAVTSLAAPVAEPDGSFRYDVARAIAGTAAQWYAGESVFDTGKTGNGFIDLYSIAGVATPGAGGPTIVGNVRFGDLALDWAPRWAVGNLRGLYHYAADVYGFGAGDATASNLVIDAANGVRIRTGAVVYAQLAAGIFTLGLPTGNRVQWDGTDLVLVTPTVSITPGQGIAIQPNPTPGAIWENLRAYSFAGTDGRFGLHAWDTTLQRSIYFVSEWTGATDRDAQIFFYAHSYKQGGTEKTAQITLNAFASGANIAVQSDIINLWAPSQSPTTNVRVDGDGTTFANRIESAHMIRVKGWSSAQPGFGLGLELGVSGGEGVIQTYNRTAGTYAAVLISTSLASVRVQASVGYVDIAGGVRQVIGSYLYPGSVDANLGSNQTVYYLASTGPYSGLYTNGAFYCETALRSGAHYQLQGGYLYPGSISGYGHFQTSVYLASHQTYGLYSNTGGYFNADVRVNGSVHAGSLRDVNYNGNTRIEFDATFRIWLYSPAAGAVLWDGVHWFPADDNVRHLGAAGSRWLDAYITNGVITGSDARQKRDITPTIYRSAFLRALDPVDYAWIRGTPGRFAGLIAQDVARVAPDFGGVARGDDGIASGLNYGHFIAPLIAGWQEHDARIAALEERIAHGE